MILALLACHAPDEETGVTDTAAEDAVYQSAAECGECHARQFAEWEQSMHRYGALSPVFDAMAAKAYRDTAGSVGTFCTGCHSPIGTLQGEPGTTTAADRSPISREGIGCDVCHTAVEPSGPLGNANVHRIPGPTKVGPYDDPVESMGHQAEHGEFLTSPEMCGSCHDVYTYPGLRIEEAYTEHLTSPARAEGTRCQDCHMSPEPGVPGGRPLGPSVSLTDQDYPDREQVTHRFVGPDYSLLDAFPYPDDLDASAAARDEYLGRVETLLKHGVGLGDVTATRTDAGLDVSVTVESHTNGHNVPTGFTSERQLWVEVAVTDADGNEVYHSGDLDTYGDLRDAHSWDVMAGTLPLDEDLVNFESENVVFQREYTSQGIFDEHSNVMGEAQATTDATFPFDANTIRKHSLSPLEARVLTYAVPDAPAGCTVTVTLHYRNLPPYVLHALDLDDLVERLHPFVLGETTVSAP